MGVWKEGENIGILENVVGILTIYVMYNAGESSVKKIERIYHFAMDMHKGQSESPTLDDVSSIVDNIYDWASENEKLESDLLRKNIGMTKNALADNLNDMVNSGKSDPKQYEAGREFLISIMEEMEFIAKIDGDDLNKTTQSFLDWLANRWEFEVSKENREFLTKDDIPSDMKEILEESDLEWDVAIVSESDKNAADENNDNLSNDGDWKLSALYLIYEEEPEDFDSYLKSLSNILDPIEKIGIVYLMDKQQFFVDSIESYEENDKEWFESFYFFAFKNDVNLLIESLKTLSGKINESLAMCLYFDNEYYYQEFEAGKLSDGYFKGDSEEENNYTEGVEKEVKTEIEEKLKYLNEKGVEEFKVRFSNQLTDAPKNITDSVDEEDEIIEEQTEPVEAAAANEKKDKEKPPTQKKRTLQGQLADEIVKLYPNAEVKKIDKGTYLDIHLPDVHSKRGTHLWFNTPKAGGIKLGFFCRDAEFNNKVVSENSSSIEQYSNGVRLLGFPTFKKVDDAIKVAQSFINNLKN